MKHTHIAALILVISSIIFMSLSIYFIANNMVLASIVSLASGFLALSGGLNIMRMRTECHDS